MKLNQTQLILCQKQLLSQKKKKKNDPIKM